MPANGLGKDEPIVIIKRYQLAIKGGVVGSGEAQTIARIRPR